MKSVIEILRNVKELESHLEDFEEEKSDVDFKSWEVKDLAKFQHQLKGILDSISSSKSYIQKVFDFVRIGVLPESMSDQDIEKITVADVGRVSLTNDLHVSILKNRRKEAYEWLDFNGHGDLVQETVNSSSLKALVKAKIKAGEPMPEDLFKVSPFTRASITKN